MESLARDKQNLELNTVGKIKTTTGGFMFRFVFFSFVTFLLLFSACRTTYLVSYDSYLTNSPSKSLNFNDNRFEFSFIPVSNGIWFSIKNNSNQTAYLVWDKSYFIEPSGNSYKALDYDAIVVTDEVARKENNESPIPANSTFSRFTTSNTNVTKFKEHYTTSTTVYSYFSKYNYSATFHNEFYNEFFDIGAYWKTQLNYPSKYSEFFLDRECKNIKEDILLNNKLGLGLFIKQNEELYEYRFDFRIKQVNIYEVEKNNNILKRELKETSNFDYSPN